MNDAIFDLPVVVPLEGATNLRDLGGYQTTDGRRVARGKIYRSAALHTLTDTDLATLLRLGVRVVCDFRGEAEQAHAPSRLPASAQHHSLAIQPTIGASLRDLAENAEATGDHASAVLQAAYATYPLDWAHRYRAMFDLLLAEQTPLLFHCTAGKDRTGVLIALLLKAIGVADEVIAADYERSDVFAKNLKLRGGIETQFEEAFGFRPNQALIDAMIGVDVALLHAALDALVAQWGSIEGYFAAADIDAGLLDRFCMRMVVATE